MSDDICDRLCIAIATGHHGSFGLVNPDGPRAAGEIQKLRAEIARLRLTDEEREAIEPAIDWYADSEHPEDLRHAATLRKLLERLK